MSKLRILLPLLCAAAMALPARGAIEWLSTEHDFGAFHEDDGKVSCEFRFVNLGEEPVSVRAARASCGCTAPSFTKDAIAKGDTGVVKVTFNPTGRPGRFAKRVVMDIAGAYDIPRQQLLIKGVVIGSSNTLRSRYPVEKGSIKLKGDQLAFGTVLRGKAKSTFLEVYNAASDSLPLDFPSVPGYIRLTPASKGPIPPGEQMVYSVVLTPNASTPYGILTDSLQLEVPGEGKVNVDLTAIVEEDFSTLTPRQREEAPVASLPDQRLDFGRIPAGSAPQTRIFEITNKGKNELLIHRVYTADPGVEVALDRNKLKRGKSARVSVTVDPSRLPGDLLNARILVIANDPENPQQVVRVVGEIVE